MDQRLSLAAPHICSAAAADLLGFCGNHIFIFYFDYYYYVNLSSLLIFEKAPFCLVAKPKKNQESSWCYFSELLMLLFIHFFRECHIWKNSHWFQGQPASQLESWQFFYCMHDALGKWAVLQLLLLGSELQKISMIIRHKKCFNTV